MINFSSIINGPKYPIVVVSTELFRYIKQDKKRLFTGNNEKLIKLLNDGNDIVVEEDGKIYVHWSNSKIKMIEEFMKMIDEIRLHKSTLEKDIFDTLELFDKNVL